MNSGPAAAGWAATHPLMGRPRRAAAAGRGASASAPRAGAQGVAARAVPATTVNVDGVGNGFTGPQGTFAVNAAPPDTNGAVGPNHYVQIVNTDYAVFNKGGAAVFGPVTINTLWSGFGGLCQTDNDGDPTGRYDPIADPWVIQPFPVTGSTATAPPCRRRARHPASSRRAPPPIPWPRSSSTSTSRRRPTPRSPAPRHWP